MVRRVAMVFGVVFLLVGILGLVMPGGMSMGTASPGMILGMFPVNLLHNVVHILFGVWGLVAARSFAGAKLYTQAGGVIYVVLAICGWLIPDTFGLLPNGGADIWLHLALGLVLSYFGFTARDTATMGAPVAAKM
jgi:hypothetical protein